LEWILEPLTTFRLRRFWGLFWPIFNSFSGVHIDEYIDPRKRIENRLKRTPKSTEAESCKRLFRADIHCHSNCSDGTDSPIELLIRAKEVNLQGISITDHDTVAAYTEPLFQKARELDLKLLSGVEISTEWCGIAIHILGYGVDVHSEAFLSFLKTLEEKRILRNRSILQKLSEKGMAISENELVGHMIGRPHIAELLVRKRYVSSLQEAFQKYLKDGASCAVSGFRTTPTSAIEEIRKAKGKAVLAHPHFYPKGSFLKKILAFPFDGVECYYGTLAKKMEAPWLQIAKEKKWIATGGSDYHGTIKPHVSLGASWVGREIFEQLSSDNP
jgi:predicted metal-dependent phosphoesterase TrpH